jgi:signal transduction histidine kinase
MTVPHRTRHGRDGGYRGGVFRFALTRLRPGHLIAADVVAALVLTGLVGYAALDADAPFAGHEPQWVSWLAAAAVTCPLAVRRRWPLPALLVVLTASTVSMAFNVIPVVAVGAPLVALALALYLVGLAEPKRTSVLALVACLVSFTAAIGVSLLRRQTAEPLFDTGAGLGLAWLVLAAGWTLGRTARLRRAYADRAAEQAVVQAVADERLRIARELHDIVAHSMSLIAVKAGIGNHVAESRPAEAREALRVIESTSRGSLAEMRHLLGVLRSEVDGAELAPAPGLAAIPQLASRASSAGVPVTLEVPPDAALPEGVGLAVYRIVQEAVTNVVRHAAPARCRVTVSVGEDDVRVEVTNDGPVVRLAGPSGHGLIGMRERVAMYGGTFTAGPRPSGGFAVSATIPLAQP